MPLLASTEMHRHANKAGPVGMTGETGPKQMWERACPRCAARAALDVSPHPSLSPTPQPYPDLPSHFPSIDRVSR
ncbi:hypothetical protein N430_01549 [Pseudomonas sp. CC120222-01a]|nr:hypothetical protein N430_01549 [Pseudomonas sp. CC120222-01a]